MNNSVTKANNSTTMSAIALWNCGAIILMLYAANSAKSKIATEAVNAMFLVFMYIKDTVVEYIKNHNIWSPVKASSPPVEKALENGQVHMSVKFPLTIFAAHVVLSIISGLPC